MNCMFYRKELLQCGVLNPEKDLYLGKLALSKHPKSPETWIHRLEDFKKCRHEFNIMLVHPKMKILSVFTHPHAVPNLCVYLFC